MLKEFLLINKRKRNIWISNAYLFAVASGCMSSCAAFHQDRELLS